MGMENLIGDVNETGTNLSEMLNLILNSYFVSSYCTIIIGTNLSLSNINIPTVVIKSDTRSKYMKQILLESWNLGCTDSVIKMWDPTDAIDIFDDIVHTSIHRNGERKIIIVPTKPNVNIVKEQSLKFIPNILIVTKSDDEDCESFDLTTRSYTGDSRNNEKVMLDKWSSCSGFKYANNLFPHNMKDLLGKVVKVAAFEYQPYVFLNLDKTVSLEGHDGTEMRIVMEFCRWLNCTLELVVDEKHEWGKIFDDRTGNGVLGAIAMDKADMGITALYSWYHEYNFLDLSMPAIRTGITCLVPLPTLIPGWKLTTIPFTVETWLSVGASLLILTFVLWFISKLSFMEVAFISYRLMIMQCCKDLITKDLRILIIWYVLAGMLLDASYSGSLASSLTLPRYGFSIDTVQDLKNSDIYWGATHDAWIFSITSSNEPTIVQLVKNFRILSEKELRSKTKGGKFAFSIERLPAGHYAVGDYIQAEDIPYLQLMQEDIYWEQCLMMARKSSPYTKKYNQLLSRLHSSGILLAWETQVLLKHSDMKLQVDVRHSHNQHRHPMTEPLAMSKVLGALIVLGLGYAMSTAVFLLELFSQRISKPRKSTRTIPYIV